MLRRVYTTLFCALLCVVFAASAHAATTRIVIKYEPSATRATAEAINTILSATYPNSSITLNSFNANTHKGIIAVTNASIDAIITTLRAQDAVLYAHRDIVFSTDAQITPWGDAGDGVNAIDAHVDGATGSGVLVAIVDSGANLSHEDLVDNLWNPSGNTCIIDGETVSGGCPHSGYDFANNDNNPTDDHGHGTHVAGIVAAADNSVGVIGVAPEATLMIVKVLDSTGYGSYTTIVEGIQFAIDNGAQIINLSLGSLYDGAVPQDLLDVIQAAEDAGVVVVAAAGNDATPVPYLPSQFNTILSVGAVQQLITQNNPETSYNTRLAYFSNWGKIDVVAPGIRINSTTYDGGYSGDTWEGTSMASPYVAGVAALLLSEDTSLTPEEVRFVIKSTATDLGTTGGDDFYGTGLVNAPAALAALSSTTTTVLAEPAWSDNNFEDIGDGYYDTTAVYSGRLPADGSTQSIVRIQVRRANGTAVVHADVNASLSIGTIVSSLPVQTDAHGIAYLTIQTPSSAADATLTVTAGSTSDTTHIIFADTLFVHDAGEPDDVSVSSWFTTRALESVSEYWTQSTRSVPADSTELSHYRTVIWDTGTYSLNIEEQELLAEFLQDDKQLILFSGNGLSSYAYYSSHEGSSINSIDTLLSDELGVSFVASAPHNATIVGTGDMGTFSIESPVSASDSYAKARADVITARTGSEVLGYFCNNAEDAIVRHTNGYTAVTVAASLDLFSKTDRENLLQRTLNAVRGDTHSDTGIASGCDTADDGVTVDAHAETDLSSAPQIIDSEGDALDNVSATLSGTSATVTWQNDSAYRSSEARATNITTHGAIDATGSRSTITLDGLDAGATYIIAITVSSNSGSFAPYYMLANTSSTEISGFTLETTKRKKLKITSSTTLGVGEIFEYELRDVDDQLLKTEHSSSSTHTFSDLSPRTSYHMRVRTVGNGSASEWSDMVKVKTLTDKVKKPTLAVASSSSLQISWEKPEGSAVKKYRVELYQKLNGEYRLYAVEKITTNLESETQSFTFTNLNASHGYRVRVRATFSNGDKGTYSKYTKIKAADF
ncbi:MAG: S8 family serine peptidase [Candidatus Kerfeldbacteria bacterium]|nr:S8 family serine peptidase [Candidatus Kerfeldbacteria bacterium]